MRNEDSMDQEVASVDNFSTRKDVKVQVEWKSIENAYLSLKQTFPRLSGINLNVALPSFFMKTWYCSSMKFVSSERLRGE